ncbi:hypothetical protein [Pseudomonas nicosulfuronedens]
MQNLFRMTLGGLSAQYYFRQLFFGSLFLAIMVWGQFMNPQKIRIDFLAFSVLCTLLYPYSRFVYERIVGFIVGDNVFFWNAGFMLMVKAFTMMICWMFSIFIAPIGLIYLFFYHRNNAG